MPLAHSLDYNEIGDEGASALAAILKETQITHLECAAAPIACLSAPVDTRVISQSLLCPSLAVLRAT